MAAIVASNFRDGLIRESEFPWRRKRNFVAPLTGNLLDQSSPDLTRPERRLLANLDLARNRGVFAATGC